MATGTYGALSVREVEEMPFSRYEKMIAIVTEMHRPRKEGETDA